MFILLLIIAQFVVWLINGILVWLEAHKTVRYYFYMLNINVETLMLVDGRVFFPCQATNTSLYDKYM